MDKDNEIYDIEATDLVPDPHNPNEGTPRGLYMLEESVSKLGLGRSILISDDGQVIAGNKTLQAAIDAGLVKVRVVETDGETLVAVKRTDIKAGSPEAAEMAIADNQVGWVNAGAWDVEELEYAVEGLGIELKTWFWEEELEELFGNTEVWELEKNAREHTDNRSGVAKGVLVNIGDFAGFVSGGARVGEMLVERFGNGDAALASFLLWLESALNDA
jgi:hypothetical protein